MKSMPKDIHQYVAWLKKEHEIEILSIDKTYYESVTNKIRRDFKESDFWVQLTKNLNEFDGEFMIKTGYPLLMDFEPQLYMKPFASFLLKTFRKNILNNKNWPNEPKDGWILPNDWYSRINDIVRTLFVVKYLDGIEFMIRKIVALCNEQGMLYDVNYEAREEGYYAAHLNTKREFEIPKITWDTITIEVSIEIQITTQLQEVIRKLLHKYYEERRKGILKEDTIWQWDYKSDEFIANYLGHILHYVEGMIMEIREKQKKQKEEKT